MTNFDQPKPVGYPLGIIYMQKSDSRATACSDTFNKRTVKAKMATPLLLTRVEEQYDFARIWIDGSKVRAFKTVTIKA